MCHNQHEENTHKTKQTIQRHRMTRFAFIVLVTISCFLVLRVFAGDTPATYSDNSGITFVVDKTVEKGGKYGADSARVFEHTKEQSLSQAWLTVAGGRSTIEAMSPAPEGTVAVFTRQNLFAKAVHAAFFGHHPLVLSPDVIWTTIAQGLAHHVDQNAEELRKQFVMHDGKMQLEITRPSFVKGSPNNNWPDVFPEFSELIKKNSLPGTTELLENNFTTTGPVEKVVSHITLMDAVQHYFTYSMACGCGFPSITLSGTPADWEQIRNKATQLKKYDLDWWLSALLPALDQFVAAAHGQPDLDFWMSLCHINVGLSFPRYEPLTGWVQVFFPYLIDPQGEGPRYFEGEADDKPKMKLRRNTFLDGYVKSFENKMTSAHLDGDDFPGKNPDVRFEEAPNTGTGVELKHFPPGMSSAPFTYNDLPTRKKHNMVFMGGVTTLVQHADSGALEPRMGWAVIDSGEFEEY